MRQLQSKLPPNIHRSWYQYLQPLFEDKKMQYVKDYIGETGFLPLNEQVFRVFEMPLDQIRVVILGQDPYPIFGQANGLAFAVNENIRMPKSLKIIADEIEAEGLKSGFYDSDVPYWRTLEAWSHQGVFLLNTALTVEPGNSGSHSNIWMWFTKEVVRIISIKNPCIWLLWGAKAQGFADHIRNYFPYKEKRQLNPQENTVLVAPHPAAEAYKPDAKNKFTGCNHFKLTNEILTLKNQAVINW